MSRRAMAAPTAVVAVVALLVATLAGIAARDAASAAGPSVVIGNASYPLAGTDLARRANALVTYTAAGGQSATPTNKWGAEVTVVGGVVTAVADRESVDTGPVRIPASGTVLSGHGAARLWLLTHAKVGAFVRTTSTAQSTMPVTVPSGTARIGTATYPIDGNNVHRTAESLVTYTRTASQLVSPANEWGAEAAVVDGRVVGLRDRQFTGFTAMPIPANGYVLSGHGAARSWLLENAEVGAVVGAATPGTTPPPAITPPPAPVLTTGNLPNRVVGGYLTTWEGRNGASLRSVVDNTNFNLIYVSFAVGVSPTSGELTLALPPGAGSPADVKSQIAYANSKGKKVIVSVGGYYDLTGQRIGYRLDSAAKVDQFMTSLRAFKAKWGFNGMDWDLEQGERPYDQAGIIDASRRMRAEFGPSWIICFAPGPNLQTWVGTGGVLDTLGPNGWDAVGEQLYDLNLSEAANRAAIITRMTALSKKYGPSKVLLGSKYRSDGPGRAVSPNSIVDIATTRSALIELQGAGRSIRGSFVWTIQSDSDQSYSWSGARGVGGWILSNP